MKKTFRLMALAIVAMVFAACGSKTSSPEAATEAFLKTYQKGDYAALIDQMYFKQVLTEEERNEFVEIFQAKDAPEVEKKGGVASYELGEVIMAEDGQKAVVKYTITYGDGSSKPDDLDLVLVDGEWKPNSGK